MAINLIIKNTEFAGSRKHESMCRVEFAILENMERRRIKTVVSMIPLAVMILTAVIL